MLKKATLNLKIPNIVVTVPSLLAYYSDLILSTSYIISELADISEMDQSRESIERFKSDSQVRFSDLFDKGHQADS